MWTAATTHMHTSGATLEQLEIFPSLLYCCTPSCSQHTLSTSSPGQDSTPPDRSRAGLCVQSLTATVWWTSGSDGSPFKLGRSGELMWSLEAEATSCAGASRSVDAAFCTVP